MSLNRIVSGNKIPESLNREMVRCRLPIVYVDSNCLAPITMHCGDRANEEGVALDDHHNTLVMEHQALVHDGVDGTNNDCVVATKQINAPEEKLGNCARLGRFIREHKVLFAVGAVTAVTLAGAMGFLARSSVASNDASDNSAGNGTMGNDEQTNSSPGDEQKVTNGKGMTLQERFALSIGKEPVLESCFITNDNNKDVLAFTPNGHSSSKIYVQSNQTVSCPEDGGLYLTEGSVTRPQDQEAAKAASQPQWSSSSNGTLDVFISAEKKAVVGESFQPTSCLIINEGSKTLKFYTEGTGRYTDIQPSSQTKCDQNNSNVPKGVLLSTKVKGNGKGMKLWERYALNSGAEPKLESCSITNENNVDILAFTSADGSSKKINVLPRQTIACPRGYNAAFITQGSVTRPFDQNEARGESQSQNLTVSTPQSKVFISAEKDAEAGETFRATKCNIVNEGRDIWKFKLDTRKEHIRVMPESETKCDKYSSSVPAGKLLNPHITDFLPQPFTLVSLSDKTMRIQLAEGVATQGKGFVFDDKYYMEPTDTTGDNIVFTLKSALPQQPTKLRLVDKTIL